ncbi:hypothetical protein HLH26_17520 [Gluconacetobacter sp. 1b LMG 1731]|uniref:DUF2335 domain-containing protein n=1 Tax=Gluconacetobacter dulcium TaxID=2729096 RepID=A0A7W4INT8_9PROT|nr:hypothetical protein [Gluconacetobacter dulcium]MBB2166291.1 hypothetical protein [Gluconacetobacter dulcium]MBB2195449.1 hypothetical protein [Gluconacetobacter dulcium]
MMAAQKTVTGPIPASEEMSGYKEVREDLPDRIMSMAEKNSEAERKMRLRAQVFQFCDALVQRIFALSAFSIAMYCTYLLAISGHDNAAIAVGSSTAITVVGSFLYREIKVKATREGKSTGLSNPHHGDQA